MQFGFYEELRAAKGAAYDELKAGFYTLRSVEDALDDLPREQSIRVAKEAVARLTRLPLRRNLASLLGHVDAPHPCDDEERAGIASQMLALGIDLHACARFKAAIEVFDSMLQRFAGNVSVRLAALQRRGYASRMLKEFEDANFSYEQMLSLATAHHVVPMEMEARLGLGRVLIERGNPGAALPIVTAVLRRARRRELREVIAKALIDRSAINGMRGDFFASIFDSHEALDVVEGREDRDILMINIGLAFREVGHTEPALAIGRRLRETALSADHRAHATLLALNAAVDLDSTVLIDQFSAALHDHVLSPLAQAGYHEAIARSRARRGDYDAAEAAAVRMRDVARQHRMFEVEHRAELAIEDIRRGVMPAVYAFRPERKTAANEKLAAVKRSIRELCST